MTFEVVPYAGWQRCLRLANGEVEIVVTAEVGPRVIRCGWAGGPNLFREFEDQLGATGGDAWRPYGGHRLWHAPEAIPRTFWPDNGPVEHGWDGRTLAVRQPVEGTTGIAKAMDFRIGPAPNQIRVVHRLENRGPWDVTLAPWALSVMAPGGRAIVPQEPFVPHADNCLPVRPLVLWSYTDMADPRFTWGSRYIQLRQDPAMASFQKFGCLNTRGWAAYVLGDTVFLKRYGGDLERPYADHGCNTEVFTNADMLELETLGHLVTLPPGGAVEHHEDWWLFRAEVGATEDAIDAALRPLVARTYAGAHEA